MAEKKEKFPTFAIILLVIGLAWLLNDLNVISIDVPWIPLVLIMSGKSAIFLSILKMLLAFF